MRPTLDGSERELETPTFDGSDREIQGTTLDGWAKKEEKHSS